MTWRVWVVVAMMGAAGAMGARASAQGLGGTGTVRGVAKDPSGGVVPGATVTIANAVSGFSRAATTDGDGGFVFRNLPPQSYRITVVLTGFTAVTKDVSVANAVPIDLGTLTLALAGTSTTVEVTAQSLVERTAVAHTDIDERVVAKLPVEAQSGLNQAITLAAPGVVADSNGFFHPVGDHAQAQFAIDNQPVTDQQSRLYSNQISPDAVQSMAVISGVPPAEYGDKSSLVVQITTKSGLDEARSTGSVSASYGSFGTPTADATLGFGSHRVGNFLSYSGLQSDRYLDSPEFTALHDTGHSQSFFDRLDTRSTRAGALHVNVQAAKSSFDVPNTLDQAAAGQDQHQQITSVNVAPGYSVALGAASVLTANAFVRQDHVEYTPSDDPFADTPATVAQNRRLTNIGTKVDFQAIHGAHNLKMGVLVSSTRLSERFALGLTDPTFNAPCADESGAASGDVTLTSPDQCAPAGLQANDAFVPGLLPFDLSRGGTSFLFDDRGTVNEQGAYIQDDIKAGPASFNLGLRLDHYAGLTSQTTPEPRVGVAIERAASHTILRASYGRTMETPYNENLLLSSATGAGGLTDSVFGVQNTAPLRPGIRNEMEVGVQQGFGRWAVLDLGYFRKHTTNGYDFDVLFDTPIVFPISWDHSDIDGITGRLTLVQHGGFSAFTVFGHNTSRFFNPENGGLLFDSPLPTGAFRIDHDQKFQQTTNVQYAFDSARSGWVGLTWRYDSGLVAGDVPDYASALALDADQQAAIGLYCGSTFATAAAPLTSCDSPTRGATRLVIPADGTEDDDTNPPRIASRNLFDLGIGFDNLLHDAHRRVKVQLTIINLTNREALYNFLSTFSGTHFVTPRAVTLTVGVGF